MELPAPLPAGREKGSGVGRIRVKYAHESLPEWTHILILFMGIQGFAIHRDPFLMAVYLLTFVGISVIIGSHYCPVITQTKSIG